MNSYQTVQATAKTISITDSVTESSSYVDVNKTIDNYANFSFHDVKQYSGEGTGVCDVQAGSTITKLDACYGLTSVTVEFGGATGNLYIGFKTNVNDNYTYAPLGSGTAFTNIAGNYVIIVANAKANITSLTFNFGCSEDSRYTASDAAFVKIVEGDGEVVRTPLILDASKPNDEDTHTITAEGTYTWRFHNTDQTYWNLKENGGKTTAKESHLDGDVSVGQPAAFAFPFTVNDNCRIAFSVDAGWFPGAGGVTSDNFKGLQVQLDNAFYNFDNDSITSLNNTGWDETTKCSIGTFPVSKGTHVITINCPYIYTSGKNVGPNLFNMIATVSAYGGASYNNFGNNSLKLENTIGGRGLLASSKSAQDKFIDRQFATNQFSWCAQYKINPLNGGYTTTANTYTEYYGKTSTATLRRVYDGCSIGQVVKFNVYCADDYTGAISPVLVLNSQTAGDIKDFVEVVVNGKNYGSDRVPSATLSGNWAYDKVLLGTYPLVKGNNEISICFRTIGFNVGDVRYLYHSAENMEITSGSKTIEARDMTYDDAYNGNTYTAKLRSDQVTQNQIYTEDGSGSTTVRGLSAGTEFTAAFYIDGSENKDVKITAQMCDYSGNKTSDLYTVYIDGNEITPEDHTFAGGSWFTWEDWNVAGSSGVNLTPGLHFVKIVNKKQSANFKDLKIEVAE